MQLLHKLMLDKAIAVALLEAIEVGGTKFVCAVGTGYDLIRDQVTIPTRSPDETLAEVHFCWLTK